MTAFVLLARKEGLCTFLVTYILQCMQVTSWQATVHNALENFHVSLRLSTASETITTIRQIKYMEQITPHEPQIECTKRPLDDLHESHSVIIHPLELPIFSQIPFKGVAAMANKSSPFVHSTGILSYFRSHATLERQTFLQLFGALQMEVIGLRSSPTVSF